MNNIIEKAGVILGEVGGLFTKLVGFASASLGKIAGASPEIIDNTIETAEKAGNRIVKAGKEIGKSVGSVVDETVVFSTAVASAMIEGAHDTLKKEPQKRKKVHTTGKVVASVGAGLAIAGLALILASKERAEELED